MLEINLINNKINKLQERLESFKSITNYTNKRERLVEILRELEVPNIWKDRKRIQLLNKERISLEKPIQDINDIYILLLDANDLLQMAIEENDEDAIQALLIDIQNCEKKLTRLEFQRMFSGTMDLNNAFLDIQAGSGGTEAQDWAEILLRMYLRWGERHNFTTELIEVSAGDIVGIRSATVKFKGKYAFGWLRTETGVHRLVRKSPFDAGNRRHTSFSAIFVSPEINDSFKIEISPSDLRIDVYRASGAGGQHVNKTESAVRITHNPTGTVVQCQNGRSQHQNKDQAMRQLRAKLYEQEILKRKKDQQVIEETKSNIGWGNQIRSYILDRSRIKDLRTGIESSNIQMVLDGGLDQFIEASLKIL